MKNSQLLLGIESYLHTVDERPIAVVSSKAQHSQIWLSLTFNGHLLLSYLPSNCLQSSLKANRKQLNWELHFQQ